MKMRNKNIVFINRGFPMFEFRVWNEEVGAMIYFNFEMMKRGSDRFHEILSKNTIMQYTGFTDIHGHDIYEGDIVYNDSYGFKVNGVIEWSDIHHAFMVRHYKKGMMNGLFNMHGIEHNLNYVGNIFENPELLKVN